MKNNNSAKVHLKVNGKVFKSIKEMCDYYGVSVSTYYRRLDKGYTTEQALLMSKAKNKNI